MKTISENSIVGVDFETALSMTGRGKFLVHLGVVVGVSLASIMTDNLGVSFVLPGLGCEFELSTEMKGLYSGSSFFGMVLTGCLWGFISDTFGRRKVLLISHAVSWLSSLSASLSKFYWVMVIFRFTAGAASAGTASSIYAYMGEFLPQKLRAKYLSYSCIFLGIGYCLLPGAAWLILPLDFNFDLGFVVIKSWRILSLVNGSYMLFALLGMLGLPESPKYLLSVDKHREAVDVLQEVFSRNTGRPPNEYPVKRIKKTTEDERKGEIVANGKLSISKIVKAMKDQAVPIFGRKYIATTIIGCVLQFWIFSSTRGLYFWLPDLQNRMTIYNNENKNDTATLCSAIEIKIDNQYPKMINCQSGIESQVYVTFLSMGVIYSMSYALSGFLVNIFGKRTVLAMFQLIGGIAIFGLLWVTDTLSFTVFAIFSISQAGLCTNLLNSVLSDLYPTCLRSTALCITLTVGRIAAGVSGVVFGIILTNGCVTALYGLSVTTIVMGILSLYIPKQSPTTESTIL